MNHLALILHAHLPFVRHPEHEHFLEEDWLFEAITETYIPLLQMMQRLVNDSVPFKLTMSLTPTLCAMLQDELLRERYVRHLDLLIDLALRERKRNRNQPELAELSEFYFELFSASRRFFVDEWKGDLLAAFRQLRDAGALEIIGCAATHGLLPLIQQQSPAAARAQLLIGRDAYVDLFQADPTGLWLPECAYAPGLDTILQEANIRWFVLDAHGLLFGNPQPQRAIYAPCYTRAGPAAFARDRDSSRQVWSAEEGYPGDPAYREFYRDVGFDLPLEHLGPIARGVRKFSGVKYPRITGRKGEKQFDDRAAADKGHLEVWIDKNNSWIYPHLHAAAQRMIKVANAQKDASSELNDCVLKQLARELLLAQASDWAFLMRTGTAREYASKRTIDHLVRFNKLHDQFAAGQLNEKFLADCEWRDNLFPNLNWRYYCSGGL